MMSFACYVIHEIALHRTMHRIVEHLLRVVDNLDKVALAGKRDGIKTVAAACVKDAERL